ncbi:hypothetical protein [Alteromonas sp. BZK5]|uniref:hypothetical protein n=1 Tax=Alteromonas sp. BZK5 TaxID=1904459 RepID=UPI001CA436DF|nr:hypothetical protein [Alteromonas sp. BZK5]
MTQSVVVNSCNKYFDTFVKVSNHELSESEIEEAILEYERSQRLLALNPGDVSAVCNVAYFCWRDGHNFETTVRKVLRLRRVIL